MSKIPVVIDCDPGVDDTFAIMMAAGYENFDIKAICSVAGNVEIEYTTKNARVLADILELKDTRVSKGAEKPMIIPQVTAAYAHGNNGMGGVELPEPIHPLDEKPAWDVIYEEAVVAKGELKLIAIGPLTNIAQCILKYPDFVDICPEITIMGGGLEGGNITPYGEFNIYADPHAAEIVFESGMFVHMIDLTACMISYQTYDDLMKMKETKTKVSWLLDQLIDRSMERYDGVDKSDIKSVKCDAAAMAYLIDPSIYETDKCYVTVETRSTEQIGRTVAYFGKRAERVNCAIITGCDRERFAAVMQQTIEKLQ